MEEEYWEVVNEKISVEKQNKIISSCKKFMPTDFFANIGTKAFKELVLAPYEKLRYLQEYIKENQWDVMEKECIKIKKRKDKKGNERETKTVIGVYKLLYESFEKVVNSEKNGVSMRVRLVRSQGITVCPYCNRDYINCRADNISGAQLDHFYSRSEYPIFSICLYNLVPSCGNCNRVKSRKTDLLASPFDYTVDWEKDIIFSYKRITSTGVKVVIGPPEKIKYTRAGNNIRTMRIEEAYQIHGIEVEELLEKKDMYSKTQRKELMEVMQKADISDKEIKEVIFGPPIEQDSLKKKPLSKMMRDLYRELEIYKD